MKILKRLLLQHWFAKLVSLVLAITLWAVIRKSIETTTSPSRNRFDADSKFQFESGYAPQKK